LGGQNTADGILLVLDCGFELLPPGRLSLFCGIGLEALEVALDACTESWAVGDEGSLPILAGLHHVDVLLFRGDHFGSGVSGLVALSFDGREIAVIDARLDGSLDAVRSGQVLAATEGLTEKVAAGDYSLPFEILLTGESHGLGRHPSGRFGSHFPMVALLSKAGVGDDNFVLIPVLASQGFLLCADLFGW
jgi:hypothetical protein